MNKIKYAKIYPENNYCIKCNKIIGYNFYELCNQCKYFNKNYNKFLIKNKIHKLVGKDMDIVDWVNYHT